MIADGVFVKTLPAGRAAAELRGYRLALHAGLPVPALNGQITVAGCTEIHYEDVFATGRCGLLLGDLIALADCEPSQVPLVVELIDDICYCWINAVRRSGRLAQLSACMPSLYLDRIRPGGRIDSWWSDSELHPLIEEVRAKLMTSRRWVTAVTQGDPTEPNIALPMCWLDFEYAGRNTIAGEIANLLWYLLALGAYLVPCYQPDVYARTLHLAPKLSSGLLQSTRTEGAGELRLGPGRAAAVERLLDWIEGDLADTAELPVNEPLLGLRDFLISRMLGVINPLLMNPIDLSWLTNKVREIAHPDTTLRFFARINTWRQHALATD